MSPIAVAFPVYNRPHCLRQVLGAWSRVRGVSGALLEFHCEPGCEEAVALCEAVDFAERAVTVNPSRLGHAANVRKSLNDAFGVTDYAIQALDDCLPATDLLELHAWHREGYAGDPTVLGLTSGRDVPAPHGGLGGVWRCQLIGALTGFHRHKWSLLDRCWGQATDQGWWGWVNRSFLQGGPGFDVLFPSLSRAEDIGDSHPGTCFAADPPPQQYYEVRGCRERAVEFRRYWEAV